MFVQLSNSYKYLWTVIVIKKKPCKMSVIINVKIITVHPNEELDLYPKANGAFA